LRRPGASLIYAGHPIVLDLRTSIAGCGYTEAGLLQAALVDLGRSYGIPTASNGLTTDSHLCDSQAAVERWNTGFLGVLAGAVLNGGAGSLGPLSTASLEQMVIDDDIYGRMARICDGVEIDTDTLALDVIAATGPNGHFIENPHTLRHMRRKFRHSALAVRLNHENWVQGGAKSVADAAHARVQSILARSAQPRFESAAVAELQRIAAAAERALAAA
jgi:trimethylamine--corrinoid protein Co-methyltransferase